MIPQTFTIQYRNQTDEERLALEEALRKMGGQIAHEGMCNFDKSNLIEVLSQAYSLRGTGKIGASFWS